MKLKMKDILKQTEFYVFCIIVAFAFIIMSISGFPTLRTVFYQ